MGARGLATRGARARATLVDVANLTLSIDDDVLRRARERAATNGTSVNQLVRDYLQHLVGPGDAAARARILALADRATSSSGPTGRAWDRDSLHDRGSSNQP